MLQILRLFSGTKDNKLWNQLYLLDQQRYAPFGLVKCTHVFQDLTATSVLEKPMC
jgi:hypothetical protein